MDYTALIAAWNDPVQPPAGVIGDPLAATDDTGTKIDKINHWLVAAPQPALLAHSAILNAVVDADLAALTALQISQLTLMLSGATVDASPGTSVRSTIQALFAGKTQTLRRLDSLFAPFDNATITWCQVNSYPYISASAGNLSVSDAENAGLT